MRIPPPRGPRDVRRLVLGGAAETAWWAHGEANIFDARVPPYALIAAGLSPFNPEAAALRAGRLMLEEMASRIAQARSFAFETTLSGSAYARQIPDWRRRGYHVKLVFLSLPSAEMAVARVAARVEQGGHSIPEPVIRRRFEAGLRNFHEVYKPLVEAWTLYDNSDTFPVLIDRQEHA